MEDLGDKLAAIVGADVFWRTLLIFRAIQTELSKRLIDTETRMAQAAKLLDRNLKKMDQASAMMTEAGDRGPQTKPVRVLGYGLSMEDIRSGCGFKLLA